MSSNLAVPATAASLLNALGLGELATLTRDEALDAVPGELAAAFYGMCWMGDLEDQLLIQRYMLTNSTNQIDLNNQGVEIWMTREKIMKSQWPADEAKQRVIRDLLAADLATGTPADPPTPPLTQVITSSDDPPDDPDDPNDTPLEKLENELKAQQATADAVLDKLNDYAAAGEAMVDWPTDASTEAKMSAWLSAQGVSQTDLSSDSVWLTDLGGIVVKPSDVATPIDFNVSFGATSRWVQKIVSSDIALMAWDGSHFMHVTQTDYVRDRSWASMAADDVIILNWGGIGQETGTVYTAYTSDGSRVQFFTPESSTLGSIVPDDIGTAYTVNGKTVRVWSDGTSIYTIDANLTYDSDRGDDAIQLFRGDPGDCSMESLFGKDADGVWHGIEPAESTSVITSVDGSRRAVWANVFETKINALQTNTANFTSAIATTNIQVQDSLTNYNVAACWVTNMLKVWADLLNAVISKL